MATACPYIVTGIGACGDEVEMTVLADSIAQARQKAQAVGLWRVKVSPPVTTSAATERAPRSADTPR